MLHLTELVADAKSAIEQATDIVALNAIRVMYMGKKGYFSFYMEALNKLPHKQRPAAGALINKAKKQIQQALNTRKIDLENAAQNIQLSSEVLDVSLPGRSDKTGCLHPITLTIDCVEGFFADFGFTVVTGPEIEDSYYNFDALNIPEYHPARDIHDTFWFDAKRLLRTQTSGIQIRVMKTQSPPIRIVTSGRVYRNDYDHMHTPMFHQVEGLIIDKNISFLNLKDMLHNFLHSFFEGDLQIRFRPSYFPFTEPSVEVDIIGKDNKWFEVLGCGMVHPNVLRNVNLDPEIYSGFAFGIGVERLTMLRYGLTDLRVFFENDLRFLKQFK